jgi:hypothetical protein
MFELFLFFLRRRTLLAFQTLKGLSVGKKIKKRVAKAGLQFRRKTNVLASYFFIPLRFSVPSKEKSKPLYLKFIPKPP